MNKPALKREVRAINTDEDIILVRRLAQRAAATLGFSAYNQTKIVTAVSELARNTLEHGGGGEASISLIERKNKRGLQFTFSDHGPGIPDINQALKDGYTTRGGMGLGLGGSKRLMDELEVISKVNEGTTVTAVKWIS